MPGPPHNSEVVAKDIFYVVELDIVDVVGVRPTEGGQIMVHAPYPIQFQDLVNELKERGLLMRVQKAKQFRVVDDQEFLDEYDSPKAVWNALKTYYSV
ncbi:hypothetical protein E4U16_006046 [Claviceps sp. LM84 group G4]|nr:hypothetical protein E4U16_006046 [Claviceps sp. LM84 group G4]